MSIHKILITGPESTGKSTLAVTLAKHFQTYWVPEYARQYLDHIQRPYVEDDLRCIAKGQMLLEEGYIGIANKLLFVDTGMTVLSIWSQEKYGHIHPWIEKKLQNVGYDLVLLMDTDLPWVYDKQREHPNDRKRLLSLYRKSFEDRGIDYHLISGSGEERFQKALSFVNNL